MWPSVTWWSPGKALGEEWVGLGSQKGLCDGHHEGMKASLGRVQNLPKGWGWEQIRVQGKSTSPFSAEEKEERSSIQEESVLQGPNRTAHSFSLWKLWELKQTALLPAFHRKDQPTIQQDLLIYAELSVSPPTWRKGLLDKWTWITKGNHVSQLTTVSGKSAINKPNGSTFEENC